MTTPFAVAVVQLGSVAFDAQRTLARLEQLVGEAAAQGARLVVGPEALFPCYPKGLDFGARVGMRSPEGRAAFRRYFESAVEVPGPLVHQLGQLARRHSVILVVGVVERAGGTLYCSALTINDDGTLLAVHRKVMPTAMERLIWGYGDGSTLGVTDTPLGRIGAVICWENYMPLLRTAMYGQGVQLYCAPTVDDRDTWVPTMQHIAVEGRCFVLSSCQYATRADYPANYDPIQGNDPSTVLIRGGSMIVSPLGRVLGGPVYGRSCSLVAEVDLGEIAEGKYDLDVVGHYARPDIFRLSVSRDARHAVSDTHDAAESTDASRTQQPEPILTDVLKPRRAG